MSSATVYTAPLKTVAKGWVGPYQDEEGNEYFVNESLNTSCWAADVPLEEEAATDGANSPEAEAGDDAGLGDDFMIVHKVHTDRKKPCCEMCADDLDSDGEEAESDDLVALMKSQDLQPPHFLKDNFKYVIPKPWKRPTSERAEDNAKEYLFENGGASFMSTSISEFQHLGTGVWLYFSWLRGLAVCLAVLSIFHIPAMLLCSSGEGTAEDDRDSFGIWRYTLGNVGAGPQSENGLFSETISWLGGDYKVQDTGPILATYAMLGTFCALIPFWLWSRSNTSHITNMVKMSVVKAEDYSVFISRVPDDLDGCELAEFLSGKFDVSGKDWAGRDSAEALPHGAISPVVQSITHVPNKLLNGFTFEGSGIADVQLVYSDAESIHAFIRRQEKMGQLRRYRSLCKMYGKAQNNKEEKVTMKCYEASDEKRLRTYLHKEQLLAIDLDEVAENLDKKGYLLEEDLKVIGAFVTFNSAIAAERCIKDFTSLNKKRKSWLYKYMCRKLPPDLLYGEEKKVLKVVRAPPPEDVIWESMRFEMYPRLRKYLQWRSTVVVLIVLLVSFIVITVISTFANSRKDNLPDLSLCDVSAPSLFLSSSEGGMCTSAGEYAPTRPEAGSSERTTWDTNCQTATGYSDSYFVVYVKDGDAARTYLNGAVNYADATDMTALTLACGDQCPSDRTIKCPCMSNKDDVDGCKITKYNKADDGTCAAKGESPLKDNLLVACYCKTVMVNAYEEHGFVNGPSEAYASDKDMCTSIFKTYSEVMFLSILTSATTAVANKIIEITCSYFADHEGHINYEMKELRMLQRNLWSQIFNTVAIPLLVAGRPTEFESPLPGIFVGQHKDMMSVADDDLGQVHREWYSDIGSEFVLTFLILAFFECYGPMIRYHKFMAQKKTYKKMFSEKKSQEIPKKLGRLGKCCRFIRMGFGIEHPPYSLQSDVDKFFRCATFRFEDRYTQVLCLLAIVLAIGPAVPCLFPMGAVTLALIYNFDKYLVVKYHSRPEIKVGRSLQDTINSYLIWGILTHTGFAGWSYCNNVLSRKWDPDDTSPSTGSIAEKFEFEASWPLLPAGMASLALVLLMPEKAGAGIWASIKHALRFKEHDDVNTALFSEEYEVSMPDGAKISKHDEKLGFRFDQERKVKYKVTPPPKKAKMKTWEVIHQDGLHTYYRGANPRYENAIAALEEAQQNIGNDENGEDDI